MVTALSPQLVCNLLVVTFTHRTFSHPLSLSTDDQQEEEEEEEEEVVNYSHSRSELVVHIAAKMKALKAPHQQRLHDDLASLCMAAASSSIRSSSSSSSSSSSNDSKPPPRPAKILASALSTEPVTMRATGHSRFVDKAGCDRTDDDDTRDSKRIKLSNGYQEVGTAAAAVAEAEVGDRNIEGIVIKVRFVETHEQVIDIPFQCILSTHPIQPLNTPYLPTTYQCSLDGEMSWKKEENSPRQCMFLV